MAFRGDGLNDIFDENLTIKKVCTAEKFIGDGSQLTNLPSSTSYWIYDDINGIVTLDSGYSLGINTIFDSVGGNALGLDDRTFKDYTGTDAISFYTNSEIYFNAYTTDGFLKTSGSSGLIVVDSTEYYKVDQSTPQTIGGVMVASFTNDDYMNTDGENSIFCMRNPSGSQNVVYSEIGGVMVAKWRTDNAGNISWISGATNSDRGHYFFIGGDYPTGACKLKITSGGCAFGDTNAVIAVAPQYPIEVYDSSYNRNIHMTEGGDVNAVNMHTSGVYKNNSFDGLTGTFIFDAVNSGSITTMTFSGGILTGYTTL